MEDRIKINGIWYVKEEQTDDVDPVTITPIEFIGFTAESDDYVWEVTRQFREDSTLSAVLDIKFIDRTSKPWKEDYWDNIGWVKGVLENNPESILEAQTSMSTDGIKYFQAFLKILKNKGWL